MYIYDHISLRFSLELKNKFITKPVEEIKTYVLGFSKFFLENLTFLR